MNIRHNETLFLVAVVLILTMSLVGSPVRAQSDTIAPTVSIQPGTPGPTADNTPTFGGFATDSASSIAWVKYMVWSDLDGSQEVGAEDQVAVDWTDAAANDGHFDETTEEYTLTTPPLADGPYIVKVKASDTVGNITTPSGYASRCFIVDTTPPDVSIDLLLNGVVYGSAPDGPWSHATEVTVGLANVTNVSSPNYWDGSSWVENPTQLDATGTTLWSFAMPELEVADAYQVIARAIDEAGNQSPALVAAHEFTYNTVAPTVNLMIDIPYLANAVGTISGTASDDIGELHKVQVLIETIQDLTSYYWSDGANGWIVTETWNEAFGTASWTYDCGAVVFTDGLEYELKVRSVDKAGNSSDESTDTFSFDGTPPQVTVKGGMTDLVGTTTAEFSGTVTDATSPVTAVEFRVLAPDGVTEILSWTAAAAFDGAFDGTTEFYTFTAEPLDSDESYTVEVRATDTHGNSGTLSVRPPQRPSNQAPADAAVEVTTGPTLTSSEFSDPDVLDTHSYSRWQVRRASGNYNSPAYDSGATASSLTAVTVPANKLGSSRTYYWRVKQCDSQGIWSAYSEETSFTTAAAPPNPPQNVSPGDGATDISLTPALTSSSFSDPDSAAVHEASEWQIARDALFTDVVYDSGPDGSYLTNVTVPSGVLSYSTSYYWRVRHQNSYGVWSGCSSPTAFMTASVPPDQPSNVSPADGATDISFAPTLMSSPFADAESGDIHAASEWRVATDRQFAHTIYISGRQVSSLTNISLPSGILTYETTYYWGVRYQDNRGNWSPYSEGTSFTVIPLPDAPVARFSASPTSGAASLEVTFTDESTGVIELWEWDFDGDGTVDTTERNPTVTFSEGKYTVSLTVSGPGGSSNKTWEECISAEGGGGLGDCGSCNPLGSTGGLGSGLLVGWVVTGLCWGTGYCLVRRAGRRDTR